MFDHLNEVAKIIGAHTASKNGIGAPFFADKRYLPVPFSAENFCPASAEHTCRKLAFIDAGNMEIFASPGLSVHFIRAYFCIFRDNLRVSPRKLPSKLEFFCVASADANDGLIRFSGRLIPADSASKSVISEMGVITLDANEPTISRAGGMGATISVMGSVARRFSEWLYASKIAENELGEEDILVRDGALITAVKGEAEFAKRAYDAAESAGAILCACAKTSELLTSTGMPLGAAVQLLAERHKIPAPWAYHPVAKNSNPDHRGEIFICNFHEKTRRAFRFEIEKNCAANLSGEEKAKVFGAVASNSRDGAFLGYPYGLIDADANSRISFKEAMNHRAMLLSMLKRSGTSDMAELFAEATDAHDVLNDVINPR